MGEAWLGVAVKREITKRLQGGYKVVTIREKRMTSFFAENGLTFFVKYVIIEVWAFCQRTGASGPSLYRVNFCPGALVKKITFKIGVDFLKILCYTIYRK